jgi:hypothetical protein
MEDNKKHGNSERMKGENNPNWNGGVSEYPNHAELKRLRKKLMIQNNNECQICGGSADITHHIDGSKDNHSESNLVCLCHACHYAIHRGITKSKTSKYIRKYGYTLDQLAIMFGISKSLVYNREKKNPGWLKRQLQIFTKTRQEYEEEQQKIT